MKILVAGEWTHADFADVVKELKPQAQFLDGSFVVPDKPPPDLFVLAQARRHQFTAAESAAWLSQWPTTPAVLLLSSWCEGETRSGKPLAGWSRVLWHRWFVEFSRFSASRQAQRASLWDRTIDDRGAATSRSAPLSGGQCFDIGVYSRWNGEVQMIESMLLPLGHMIHHQDGRESSSGLPRRVDVSLIVGDSCDPWMERSLTHAKLAGRRTLKIIIMGFPRRQEIDRLQQLGGRQTRVLAKPFEIHQLQHLLQLFAASRNGFAGNNR